jgi:small subunit ribosomal protein S6
MYLECLFDALLQSIDDERVIRFLTLAVDKHALAYNEKKRKGLVGRKPEKIEE